MANSSFFRFFESARTPKTAQTDTAEETQTDVIRIVVSFQGASVIFSLVCLLLIILSYSAGRLSPRETLTFGGCCAVIMTLAIAVSLLSRFVGQLATVRLAIYSAVLTATVLVSALDGPGSPVFIYYLVPLLIAGLCATARDAWMAFGVSISIYTALTVLFNTDTLSPLLLLTPDQRAGASVALLIATGTAVAYVSSRWNKSTEEMIFTVCEQSEDLFRQTTVLSEQNAEVLEVGNELAAASTQLLAAAEQQARGATEQASAVAEVSTTIEELGATARQIALAAEQVAEAASETLINLADGQAAVDTAIQAMGQIRTKVRDVSERVLSLGARSTQIGEIIDVINDLSDETHLLALNAAIEAAGAGEHGRRFAVVAAEVKSLANRALSAAKEVKGVIAQVQQATTAAVLAAEDGGSAVERGVELANQAGAAMDQIVVAAERTVQAATEISLATAQQQSASEQIVETMREVAGVTRQSAATARQTTGGAQSLAVIAARLHALSAEA